MAKTAEILSKKNEILSKKADFWEEQYKRFHSDLAPEDLAQLCQIAEKMRIEWRQKKYLALVKENHEQLIGINNNYAGKGIRLNGLKKQSAAAPAVTETTSGPVEAFEDDNGIKMR